MPPLRFSHAETKVGKKRILGLLRFPPMQRDQGNWTLLTVLTDNEVNEVNKVISH